MGKVLVSTEIKVPADEVWGFIGRWNALPDWHPGVTRSDLENGGEVRRLSLFGGGVITEKLETRDDAGRSYTYSLTGGTLPVANYVATLSVTDEGDTCKVHWTSKFDPAGISQAEATDLVRSIYQAGLDNLKKVLKG